MEFIAVVLFIVSWMSSTLILRLEKRIDRDVIKDCSRVENVGAGLSGVQWFICRVTWTWKEINVDGAYGNRRRHLPCLLHCLQFSLWLDALWIGVCVFTPFWREEQQMRHFSSRDQVSRASFQKFTVCLDFSDHSISFAKHGRSREERESLETARRQTSKPLVMWKTPSKLTKCVFIHVDAKHATSLYSVSFVQKLTMKLCF